MKITDVEIQNFLAIGEAKFSLDALGLVHIRGENDEETSADSNGSGKSSLADAISWCLWDTTARGLGGDDVVNTAEGKNCRVAITIDDGGDLYRVVRHRKFVKHKNALHLFKLENGQEIDLTKGTAKLTQAQIERILGCSEEVFNAAVYSGQEAMPDIPRMTDKQLKLLVEQAAGVDVLSRAYEIARERYREKAQERAHAQITYDRATERHADALRAIERANDDSTTWTNSQAAKIANLRQQTLDAKTRFEAAKAEFDPADETALRADITVTQEKIAAVNAERQREQVLAADLQQARNSLSILQGQVTGAERLVEAAKVSVTRQEQALEATRNGVGKPCTSCSRPLEAEHLAAAIERAEAAVTAQKDDLNKCVENLAAAQAKARAFEAQVTKAEQALTDHRASMTDVSAEADRLKNLQRELQILEATKAEIERLRVTAQNIANLWKNEAAAENPYKAMLERLNDDLLARAGEVDTAKKSALAAIEAEKYAAASVEVYAPAGVRAMRLDEATPYLNERTAHYLGSLADGAIEAFWTTLSEKKNGDLTERFSVTVEKAGSAPSFAALSGGEKRKVRLACALALQDLVASRATKSIELWIGDEVDDALDDAGLERLMGVLEEKARDRGTVLVISHNDIAAFARKEILVSKKAGRATVTVQ